MHKFDYLIIGGGIAGTTAAQTIRRNDGAGSIGIVSEEPHRLYSRIMLSKPDFFLGKIPLERIWLKKESWYEENQIELIGGKKAAALDSGRKTIKLDNGDELQYGKLLLAIGGCPRKWDVKGGDKAGVFYLRTLDDTKAVMAALKTAKQAPLEASTGASSELPPRWRGPLTGQAVAIGGGFISFEMCELLRMAGVEVTLVLRESYYWEPLLDRDSGRMIEAALEKGGVKIICNAEVSEVLGDESVTGVKLKNESTIPAQIIIAGIGVYCPHQWLKSSGLALNRGILTNEYLETNLTDIWAAGDAAEFKDLILGEQVQLGNWVNAQMQGRTAGANMAGKREPFRMVSFYTTSGFGMTIAFIGDVRPGEDRQVISRGSLAINSYGRLIVKDGEIIGATLINRTAELSIISKLIEKDVRVAGRENELADPEFNLLHMLP